MEPGAFLIPAHATQIAPPSNVPDGQQAYFDGDRWDTRVVATAEPKQQLDLTPEEKVAARRDHARHLLAKTDYSQLHDVRDLLTNQDDFLTFRNELRKIITSADVGAEKEWPAVPTAKWHESVVGQHENAAVGLGPETDPTE